MQSYFVHGRPGPHWFHGLLGTGIGARHVFVDAVLPYHDRPDTSRARRYASWALNALALSARDVDLILAESAYPPPTVVRNIRRGFRKPLLLAIMGDHTLHFIVTGRYSAYATAGIKRTLRSYDLIVCYSAQQEKLLKDVLGDDARYRRISGGLPEVLHAELSGLKPNLDAKRILLVGSAPNVDRAWYKGIDVFQGAIARVRSRHPDVEAVVVGALGDDLQRSLRADGIETPGQLDRRQLNEQYARSSVYLHLARGDAFPLSVLEAMSAGLPAIASNETGTSEIVAKVAGWMVVENDPGAAAAAVERLLTAPASERATLAAHARAESQRCTVERATADLLTVVDELRVQHRQGRKRRQ